MTELDYQRLADAYEQSGFWQPHWTALLLGFGLGILLQLWWVARKRRKERAR